MKQQSMTSKIDEIQLDKYLVLDNTPKSIRQTVSVINDSGEKKFFTVTVSGKTRIYRYR